MQIFFVSPNGYMPIRNALQNIPGQRTHGWSDDHSKVIGVVEISNGDTEIIATALEQAGVILFPDHRFGEKVTTDHIKWLSAYGVNAKDNTATAMAKVQLKSGFPPHKVRRYS